MYGSKSLWERRTGWDCLSPLNISGAEETRPRALLNGLLLESMEFCLCIVEPMLINVRLGNM